MTVKSFTIFTLLFVTISCQNMDKTPIPEATFIQILADIHTADGAAEGELMAAKDSLLRIYYAQILKKHGVSPADFDSTFAIYTRQPVAFDSVYSAVMREVQKIDTTTH
jgi:Domain of unknown function (DUF4296)